LASPAQKKNTKNTKNTTGKPLWQHVLIVAILFALCGGLIAFITPDVSADDPYKILEITKSDILSLSVDDRRRLLKSKYRELARKHHPDRGGSEESFILLTRSYEKLADSDDDDGSKNNDDDEDLQEMLNEAKELMVNVLESKLIRCVVIGGSLGLFVGTVSKGRRW
jgi:preprotein translocase subunit Sec63